MTASCEKMAVGDDVPTNGDSRQEANVVIRIADIEAGWDGESTRTMVNVAEVCTRVNLAVYQDGTRVKLQNQTAADNNFGTIALQLSPGTYQLLVLAHSGKANPTTTKPAEIQFTNPDTSSGTGFTDTFYYYGTLVVGDSGVQMDISMKRATAMFRLATTDVKPAKVKKLQFYYTGGSGALNVVSGYGCKNSKQSVFVTLDDTMTGSKVQCDMYTFLHEETGKLNFIVKAFDANDDIVYETEFNDVPMQRNCITRYTGALFTADDKGTDVEPVGPEPGETTPTAIMVDPEWAKVFDYKF